MWCAAARRDIIEFELFPKRVHCLMQAGIQLRTHGTLWHRMIFSGRHVRRCIAADDQSQAGRHRIGDLQPCAPALPMAKQANFLAEASGSAHMSMSRGSSLCSEKAA